MILIIDFGSQTTHLIGRRLRQLGVAIEYIDPEEIIDQIKKIKPLGLIFSGGPASVYEDGAPDIDSKVFALGIPIFSICYGWQLMAQHLGGKVKNGFKEYGPEKLLLKSNYLHLPAKKFQVFMSHGDTVIKLPKGFEILGSTKQVRNAFMVDKDRKFYGVQFHPEADHTNYGLEILRYFAHQVCKEKLEPLDLNPQQIISHIAKKVGKNKVICAVSGGVDSTVAAFLIGQAIGQNLIPVYVESGLMRQGTKKLVKHIFTKLIKADLVIVEAKKHFMQALKGVTDPEEKRKIIGELYIDIFQKEAKNHQQVKFLGQGTIYSDVIESKGSKKASKIKSHHNVGGLPAGMKLKLLEPVREFYKDEVRELGRIVGIPKKIVMQQPFPGPGNAVRIRGEVTAKRLAQQRQADAIVVAEIKRAGLWHQIFQCFSVMSGTDSTAVKGDARVFAEVVAVRAYESKDIMTSKWAELPYEVMQKISSRIVNEVPNVSRVVYDITTKPPATMEWE